MSALAHNLRAMCAVAKFFIIIYLTFLCMYFAPTAPLRRWGSRSWWQLFRLGPDWPTRPSQGKPEELGPVFGLSKYEPALADHLAVKGSGTAGEMTDDPILAYLRAARPALTYRR